LVHLIQLHPSVSLNIKLLSFLPNPSYSFLRSYPFSGCNMRNGCYHCVDGYRPEDAVRTFGNKLTAYEISEIYNYPRVYFVGSQAKKRGGVVGGPNNCGYDDDMGSYLLVAHDHIAYRYEVLKVIGKGSFGQVRFLLLLQRSYVRILVLLSRTVTVTYDDTV
uniref:Protein kinase domain-containing protein n=1 Tax=Toxocara canis TaxID=6265 RepID=A0A183U7U6_TOXCA